MQKSELKKISDYKNEWETSIESILKDFSVKNDHLIEEYKRKDEEIQCLEGLLEKIEEENIKIINAIDAFNQPEEVFRESIIRHSFSSSTETLVSEDLETVFIKVNKQMIELKKKNEIYKKWISALDKKLNSNLTLNYLKFSKPNLKMLEDLKTPSFKNAELKQENKKSEEIIQSLEIELEKLERENAGIHLLCPYILSEEIYLYTLDSLKKGLDNEQKEMEDIDSYFEKLQEKAAKLHENIEKFTSYLEENKNLNCLLEG